MTMAQEIARRMISPTQGALLPNPFLYTLPTELWDKAKDFFGYTATFAGPTVLPAGGSVTVQTGIQSDSAFVIVASSLLATSTDESVVLGYVPQLVQIIDQTAGRNFFDAPTHAMNVFGTAQAPSWWSIPKLILPSSTIGTTLTNLDPANARNVRIIYWGFKIFNVVANG